MDHILSWLPTYDALFTLLTLVGFGLAAIVDKVSDQLTFTDAGKKWAVATEGRVLRRYFSITIVTSDLGATYRLCPIYKDERLMGGHIAGVIAGAAGATLALGITGTVAKFMAATAIDAALNADFAHTPALGFGELQAANGEIIGTTAGGASLDGKVLAGYIDVLHP